MDNDVLKKADAAEKKCIKKEYNFDLRRLKGKLRP